MSRQFSNIFILDTNVIINFPDILQYVKTTDICVIPETVIIELGKKRYYCEDNSPMAIAIDQATRLLEKNNPNIIIAPFADPEDHLALNAIRGEAADSAETVINDDLILSVALRLKHLNPLFVTNDRELLSKAEKQEIRTSRLHAFLRDRKIPFQ